ncbi:unnamed protein product, partial [Aureobasidium vineae]
TRRMPLLIPIHLSHLLSLSTSSPLTPRQATNGPEPPTIIWTCTGNTDPILDNPSVCSNMCYGAYCRGYGNSLTFNPMAVGLAPNIVKLRKANAGCYVGIDDGPVNEQDRCQRQGMACNVSPYLTAIEGAVDVERGGPITDDGSTNPTGQNAMLNLLYTSTGPWSDSQGLNSTTELTTYHQIFANAGELPYCSGLPSDCVTDGTEVDRDGVISAYDPLPSSRSQRTYKLSGGRNVTVMQEMEPGRRVLSPRVRDGKGFVEESQRHVVDGQDMLERLGGYLYFEIEEIEGEILDGSV